MYIYRTAADRDRVIERKEAAEIWEKEAVGGPLDERWCYNCATEGHLGDVRPFDPCPMQS